jgi:hypothetical protein
MNKFGDINQKSQEFALEGNGVDLTKDGCLNDLYHLL